MDSTNNGKGYTNEQWESLLCRTFGDPAPAPKAAEPSKPKSVAQTPPTPAPPAPPAPKQEVPVPETPEKAAPVPAKPAQKKKRKIWILVWILLAVSLVFAIVAVHIFPRDDDDTTTITKEQRQCMNALQQWQSTQYYKMETSTFNMGEAYLVNGSPTSQHPAEMETYCQSEDGTLYWRYIRNNYLNVDSDCYTGKVQKGDKWFTCSGSILYLTEWYPTTDTTPIPEPWIMNYSLKDVQILHQDVQYEEVESHGKYTFITFAVMDTDRDSPFYGQGPYHIRFSFYESQLYAISVFQTNTNNPDLIATYFNLYEMSAEEADMLIQMQMTNPEQYPGSGVNSTPDANAQIDLD